jgi:hypothetical protein
MHLVRLSGPETPSMVPAIGTRSTSMRFDHSGRRAATPEVDYVQSAAPLAPTEGDYRSQQ